MILTIYKAECGDAASIKYLGEDNCFHNIFFDAGFERTFHNILFPVIETIIQRNERIDCWILSHIHSDHIGGILGYIDSIKRNEIPDVVDNWIYNPPRRISNPLINKRVELPVSEATSIRQGDIIAAFLQKKGMLSDVDHIFPMPTLGFLGLDIEILSPDIASLKKLRTKYKNSQISLNFDETNSISLATSSN